MNFRQRFIDLSYFDRIFYVLEDVFNCIFTIEDSIIDNIPQEDHVHYALYKLDMHLQGRDNYKNHFNKVKEKFVCGII